MKLAYIAWLPALLASAICRADEPASPNAGALGLQHAGHSQVVIRSGSQPSIQGNTDTFTGTVRVDPLFPAGAPASFSGGAVHFTEGARSAWHTHPAGQYLIVTNGVGWTQQWGGPVVEIRSGDVVWCPPGVKHWHGATPTTAMSHIALTGTLNGKNVDWMEKVSEEQYRK
ncbi:MAG: cupin domain protein [Herminiimonas sp.]|nr:cupin domain protein [Herminiimonas sp.]MDB5855782.1 cupin domain protein [Herminiimonas sp.]